MTWGSRKILLFAALLLGPGALTPVVEGDDWPQWMGPQRDGSWAESGVVAEIPAEGLAVAWRAKIGMGYAGPAVAGERVFVPDYLKSEGELTNQPSARDELSGSERLVCLDRRSGRQLWAYEYPCQYRLSYPGGPRVTPTVDGERVYGLGAEGRLYCLSVETGEELWARELKEDYKIEAPIWGFCGHPLVDGDQLICLVGGEGSVLVSFDKLTGKERWRSLTAPEPGYCPPRIIDAGGRRQLIIWHSQAVVAVDPATGGELWSIELAPGYGMAITAPQLADNLLYASGIGNAAAAIQLDTSSPRAEVLWRGTGQTAVYCANSTPLIQDGVIFGVDCRGGQLRAVELKTGKRLWETLEATTAAGETAPHGTIFLVRNDDRYFLFNESGELILAKLTRDGYSEIGRQQILEPTQEAFGRSVVWSHPAFAHKSLFARNDKEVVCVSLEATDE